MFYFLDLLENGSVHVIDSGKMPKSLSVLPDNNNMESIVWYYDQNEPKSSKHFQLVIRVIVL